MLGDVVRRIRSLRVVALWVLLTVILGVAGPFGTEQALTTIERLAFWAAVSALAFVIGIITYIVVGRCCAGRPAWERLGMATLIYTAVFLPILRLLILAQNGKAVDLADMALAVALLPAVVGLAKDIWLEPDERPAAPGGKEDEAPATGPRLLDRLEPELRGDIVHLSVRDHYVEVLTDRGQASILMRFSDAMAELDGVEGIQTHRSHWVARSAVTGSRRHGGKTYLVIADGAEVPVSRGFLPRVRAAGYLGA